MSVTLAVGEATQLPWGAMATMFAGSAAVVAAWWIGKRQTSILDRQSKIAEGDLKIQLFERRADCVSRMRILYTQYMRNGRFEPEELNELQKLMFDIQLLFPSEVVKAAEEMFDASSSSHWKGARAHYYHEAGKPDKAKQLLEESFKHDDTLFEGIPALFEELKEHTRLDVWD